MSSILGTNGLTTDTVSNSAILTRVSLTNSGTGAGTGVAMSLNGHNGTTATSSNLTFNGTNFSYNTTSGGTHIFNGSIVPTVNNSFNFGSNSTRWASLFMNNLDTNGLTVNGSYTQTGSSTNTFTGNTIIQGTSSAQKFQVKDSGSNNVFTVDTVNGVVQSDAYVTIRSINGDPASLLMIAVELSTTSGVIDFTEGNFRIDSNFIPSFDSSVSLGNLSNRFLNVYSDNIIADDITAVNITADNITFLNPLIFSGIDNNGNYTQTGGTSNTFIGATVVQGVNSANKFTVRRNDTTAVFDVNTLTGITTCSTGGLIINTGATQPALQIIGGATSASLSMTANALTKNISLDASANINIDTNILPTLNNTYGLGSSSNRWIITSSSIDNNGAYTQTGTSANTLSGFTNMAGISNNGAYTQLGTSTNNFNGPVIITDGTTPLSLVGTTTSTLNFSTTGFSKNISMNSGILSSDASIYPTTTLTYNLGSTANRWNTINCSLISANITSGGSVVTMLDLNNDALVSGSGSLIRFGGSNGTILTTGTIALNATSMNYNTQSGGNHVFNATTRPSTSGTLALGASANRWSTLFCTTIDCSGNSTIIGTSIITGLQTLSTTVNNVISNRLTITNNGTGAGTGAQITFGGHNGTTATIGTIQFNGTNIIYNAVTGAQQRFNTVIAPVTDNAYTCGASGAKWSQLWATTATINTSDLREKNSIMKETLGLDFICQLNPVKYKFNVQVNEVIEKQEPKLDKEGNPVYEQVLMLDEEGNQMYDEKNKPMYKDGNQIFDTVQTVKPIPGTKFYHGLIAQEIQKVLYDNNLTEEDFAGIYTSDPDRYGLAYTEFIAPLIKAVQELKSMVDEQNNKILSLESKLSEK
jgi:hypothetical protein